jgi:hypothetical protein
MGRGAGALALRPPAASSLEVRVDTAAIRITGRAWLAVAALALLLTPICARADDSPSDRHEIPTFVLKRTELPPGADAAARVAAGATVADAARTEATQ